MGLNVWGILLWEFFWERDHQKHPSDILSLFSDHFLKPVSARLLTHWSAGILGQRHLISVIPKKHNRWSMFSHFEGDLWLPFQYTWHEGPSGFRKTCMCLGCWCCFLLLFFLSSSAPLSLSLPSQRLNSMKSCCNNSASSSARAEGGWRNTEGVLLNAPAVRRGWDLIKGDSFLKRFDWNGVPGLMGASEGQSAAEVQGHWAIMPPRWRWISALERSIGLARGDTSPGWV